MEIPYIWIKVVAVIELQDEQIKPMLPKQRHQ